LRLSSKGAAVFFDPGPTAFDLRFRLFGIPIRVHPMFWLFSAVLGWGGGPGERDPYFLPGLLIWIAASFVSILIHEMGHVFMGRLFGSDGHIVLYSFGGLAIGSNALRKRWQRILVSFAGPGAQFLILAVVILALVVALSRSGSGRVPDIQDDEGGIHLGRIFGTWHPLVGKLVFDLIFINLFWPVLNLLPIWPLDGGQISREVCTGISHDNGAKISLGISMLVAGLLAANAAMMYFRGTPLIPVVGGLMGGGMFTMIFFGMMALSSFRAMQQLEAEKRWQLRVRVKSQERRFSSFDPNAKRKRLYSPSRSRLRRSVSSSSAAADQAKSCGGLKPPSAEKVAVGAGHNDSTPSCWPFRHNSKPES
jgi:stage IV sporulation protein FB